MAICSPLRQHGMLTSPVVEHSGEGARLRPVGLGSVLPAIGSFAQSSDLGNTRSSPLMETIEKHCHLSNEPSSPLMETFAQLRDCTKKSPLLRWTPLHNCLFRDGRSSPAPSPVCWGRLGWGSPYHTGGYANVSFMETIAQPRDCTKKSPLLRWTPLHNCLFRDGRSSPAPSQSAGEGWDGVPRSASWSHAKPSPMGQV